MKKICILIVALFFSLSSYGFSAENPYALDTKVIKNEQSIELLKQQQADLYLKMENLLVKYGELKGRLEELENRLRVNHSVSVTSTNNANPSENQNSSGLTGNNVKDNGTAVKDTKKIIDNSPNTVSHNATLSQTMSDKDAYKKAKALYDNKSYDQAIVAFKGFKKKYKHSQYVPNAIFFIAQSYFKKGSYDQAIINYDYLINTYPKSSKIADALVKEGISFVKLGDKIDGKYMLKKVIEQYPGSSQAKLAKEYLSTVK